MRRRGLNALLSLAACLSLVGCVTLRPAPQGVALPPLRLAPADLGHALALQQQLTFRHGRHVQSLDALLEADADAVRLAVQAMGRTGVRLQWDGVELEQHRADWLPSAVRGERVLDDLQFAFWPAEVIRSALPEGWTLIEDAGRRTLAHAGRDQLVLERIEGDRHIVLRNLVEGYVLDIVSVSLDEDAP